MSALSVRLGYGVFGAPFMKFTLTYDGPLPASANKAKNDDKWRIRKELHPQLADLWATHPALRQVAENRHFPKHGGATLRQVHHFYPGPVLPDHPTPTDPFPAGVTLTMGQTVGRPSPPGERQILDLCEPLNKHGGWFAPLVRNSFALHCGLKIVFLRHEEPGKIYQAGDLDGRIKTLLDALAMPQHKEQVLESGAENAPIY